ncbi:MAG TPA: helix-turn-helix transcriptional regulator [Actinomycetota bacterium]|nr:helix-turn-helix transcriptional regulator [Actinomycetota bacterium]
MPKYRIGQVAQLIGVSGDTVRRWVDSGRLRADRTGGGRRLIDGAELARFVVASAEDHEPEGLQVESARNRLTGIVTRVLKDGVAAQVEVQAGPFRMVSLMTREAADELGLEPGMMAVASVKSTNVWIELPQGTAVGPGERGPSPATSD